MSALDLSAKHGGTQFSNYEVFTIGEALVNWLGATIRLGHSSPASTLDYTTNPATLGIGGLIVRDFVAWTSGRTSLVPDCEERLRDLAENAELDAALANKVGRLLLPGPTPQTPAAPPQQAARHP